MEKKLEDIFKGSVFAYGSALYTTFAKGRKSFEKEEFERWAKAESELGLNDESTEKEIAEDVSVLCLGLSDKRIVYRKGRYLEVPVKKRE
ncbi:hypothetical protein A9K97_gp431 [Tokyovirus A1]|uniref:hypothetical protein n=1 Tax=Tokyovirus A1 TaxID=1826170 RepID=UPI0007A96BF2|nr:hypothetical protein A9K97_gp431 [Tokyovirus A1]BAU79920.1 hypothetical protein [Tokyovirus A1]